MLRACYATALCGMQYSSGTAVHEPSRNPAAPGCYYQVPGLCVWPLLRLPFFLIVLPWHLSRLSELPPELYLPTSFPPPIFVEDPSS